MVLGCLDDNADCGLLLLVKALDGRGGLRVFDEDVSPWDCSLNCLETHRARVRLLRVYDALPGRSLPFFNIPTRPY